MAASSLTPGDSFSVDSGAGIAARDRAGSLRPKSIEANGGMVRLQALNALTALGEAARPALPVVEASAASDQEYLRNAGRYLAAVLKGEYRPDYPVFDLGRMGRA